jgi:peptidoglycan hydrolase-like protein with peptidoglycan-binding domain
MRALGIVVAGALVLAGLVGCDSSGDAPSDDAPSDLEAAQAQVEAKEKALADAEADFTEKSEAFCGSSETYIAALDRYGDVLTQTATTVGDVTTAGADLEDPRDEAESGAEAAVEAHQAVFDAEQELADAKAALAEIKNPGSAGSSSPSESSSPKPLVPAATVSRVEQAETELRAVQKGISEDTPLAEASQQFNAAVVALEMAWLRLFSDAGCLADEQQKQAEAAVRDYTEALQQSLLDAGYYEGEVDGVYGPATVDAVESLQKAHELPVTGTVDKETAAALEDDVAAAGGATAQEELVATTAVQQTLKLAGFWDGPVDGEWTPELTEALKEFQTALGVKPTGAVDAATIAALEKAIAEAQAEAEDEPSESATVDSESEPDTPSASGTTTTEPSPSSSDQSG